MSNKLQQRREKILELLSGVPISSTQQLAIATDVSSETVRKDLDALAEEGHIIKMHGGVALANTVSAMPFDLRAKENAEQKMKIGVAAAKLVEKGDAILMENSTSSMELAKSLMLDAEFLQTLVVVTNSFAIASLFSNGMRCQKLFFLGGWANLDEHATHGYQTVKMMEEANVNKAFISGAAFNDQLVVTGYYDDSVSFQQAALRCSEKAVLMLDSSKFDRTAFFTVSHLSSMDFLVTDKALSRDQALKIAALNVSYIHAK